MTPSKAFDKYWGAMLPSTLGLRLDYFSVGKAVYFALDVAAVGVGPIGYIIQIVFVDYLQLMHVPKTENRQVEIATISRGLKSLGRELGVPVIAMAQLNRMPEGRSDKRPLMSDLRESGAIEQDADLVLLLLREEYYNPTEENKGMAEVIVAKQRNGPVGTVKLAFVAEYARFENVSYRDE